LKQDETLQAVTRNVTVTAPDTDTDTDTDTEQIQKQTKTNTPRSGSFVLPPWVDPEAWAGFEEMRRKERHPLTDRARKLAITDLERLHNEGHNPAAVLNQSTMKGWRGLFALTATGGTNGNGTFKGKTGQSLDNAREAIRRIQAEEDHRASRDFGSETTGEAGPRRLPGVCG